MKTNIFTQRSSFQIWIFVLSGFVALALYAIYAAAMR